MTSSLRPSASASVRGPNVGLGVRDWIRVGIGVGIGVEGSDKLSPRRPSHVMLKNVTYLMHPLCEFTQVVFTRITTRARVAVLTGW